MTRTKAVSVIHSVGIQFAYQAARQRGKQEGTVKLRYTNMPKRNICGDTSILKKEKNYGSRLHLSPPNKSVGSWLRNY